MESSKLFKRLGLALTGMVLAIGVGVGLSQRGEYKEARADAVAPTHNIFNGASGWTTGNTTYSSTVWTDETQKCQFVYAANNDKGWSKVRLGLPKNTTNTDTYIGATAPTNYNVAKITIDVAAYRSSGNLTINSVTLKVWDTLSSKTYSGAVDSVAISTASDGGQYYSATNNGTCNFDVEPSSSYKTSSGKSYWESGVYFQLVINLSNSDSKNSRGTDINSIIATEPVVPATGVSLNETSATLAPGQSLQLTATVSPNNATDKSVSWQSSNTNYATVSNSGLVTAVAAGSATITVTTTSGSYTATCDITVENQNYIELSADVTDGTSSLGVKGKTFMITVDASNLAGNIGWSVTSGSVSGGSGDNDGYIGTFNSTGTVTIVATDSGNGENTASLSFTVLESLNAINAYTESVSNLTFTASCGGSGTASTADAASWTVTSDGTESTYDSTSGIHYGTNDNKVTYIQLTTSSISSVVRKVVVNARDNQAVATVSVTVGGKAFSCIGSSIATGESKDYVFSGNSSGAIVVRIDRGSSQTKALYVKSVKVTYLSAGTSNVANTNATVQQEVLNFVSIMNTKLSVCASDGSTDADTLATRWGELSSAFDTAVAGSSNSSLFEQMLRYVDATARALDGTATTGDSLQNALARYNYVLEKYGVSSYVDFLGRASVNKVTPKSVISVSTFDNNFSTENTTSTLIIILSIVGVATIGGYFFIRRRKER